MTNRRGCLGRVTVVSIWLVATGLAVGLCGGLLWLRWSIDEARATFDSPAILVTSPPAGTTVPAGSYVTVSAIAFGKTPISRVQIWLDGRLLNTLNSIRPAGEPSLSAHFDVLMPPGSHRLVVTATNAAGLTSNSLPVSLVAGTRPSEAVAKLTVREGEKIEEIANTLDTDAHTIKQWNPNLDVNAPAPGTVVQVPVTFPPSPASQGIPPSESTGSASIPIPQVPALNPADPTLLGADLLFAPSLFLAKPRPPLAPSDLAAQVKDCKVLLRWNDNATNETNYQVWMDTLESQPRQIATLPASPSTGPAWYEFPAPQRGRLDFWVEATNSIGKQPSNIVHVDVSNQCPEPQPTHLQVELLDMTVSGGYDKTYCYVSFENKPEVRIPLDANAFIKVQGGQGDIGAWGAGDRRFSLPIPAEGTFAMTGECWGWAGKNLNQLGSFTHQSTAQDWNGTRKVLGGAGFQIGFSIGLMRQATGERSTGAQGGGESLPDRQVFANPNIPRPYALQLLARSVPAGSDAKPTTWLTWRWDGDPKTIQGFKILLDGKTYNFGWLADDAIKVHAGPNDRAAQVSLPWSYGCGRRIRWQVITVAIKDESYSSDPLEYDQPPCQMYAQVRFNTVKFLSCDKYRLYFRLWVNATEKKFHWPCSTPCVGSWMAATCGTYNISGLAPDWTSDTHPNVVVAPVSGDNILIKVVAVFQSLAVGGVFASFDSPVAGFFVDHAFPSLQEAQKELGCGKTFVVPDQTGNGEMDYTLSIFPPAPDSNCPAKQPDYVPK